MRPIRRILLGLSADAARPSSRGFRPARPAAARVLDTVGETFVLGYNAALELAPVQRLVLRIEQVPAEVRGFAYEGAAMALALWDQLLPWRRDRWPELLSGPGGDHAYLVHVGVGWALAKLGRTGRRLPDHVDPLFGWLVFDGYGFCAAFFRPRRFLVEQRPSSRLKGYATRAFDQGLGRCLWFAEGADPRAIQQRIVAFAAERQADLWSGVGLAACYAGGATPEELLSLSRFSAQNRPWLAQGVAFAARARQRAGCVDEYTRSVCQCVCRAGADEVADAVEHARATLARDEDGSDPSRPPYEDWRRLVRARFDAAD